MQRYIIILLNRKEISVSIPQAVSTVATYKKELNNAFDEIKTVSIPQAVSTVATAGPRNPVFMGPKIRF